MAFSLRSWLTALALALAAVPALPALAEAPLAARIATLSAAGGEDPAIARIGTAAELSRFYALRGNEPVWRAGGGWSAKARAAIAVLEAADEEGLRPQDYLAPAVTADANADAARGDVLLTAGLLRYIGDVRAGRTIPSAVNPKNAVYPVRGDAAAILEDGLAASDFAAWLESLPPDDARYRNLRAALADSRAIAAEGPWPRLPDGPTLRQGDRGPAVAVLRAQLIRLGDLTPFGPGASQDAAESQEFDAALDFAVRRFQSRHGLAVDGAVGRNTRAALATTPKKRVETITVSLERMRWFPIPEDGRYIVVNSAGFELDAFEDGKLAAEMPVIVGKAKDPTPLFADIITEVTFLPTWTVPKSITREEILPQVRKDPDYFAARNMKVYSGWGDDSCEIDPREVDWQKVSPRTMEHRVVQQPGGANALGRVRFTLENDFGIFMHDTPAKRLFDRDTRAFSHGCVRVGDAPALAAFVLEGDPEWTPEAIEAAIAGEETITVPVPRPVPVEMTYLTAWVDESGIVQFRNDIYNRDPALARALSGGKPARGL